MANKKFTQETIDILRNIDVVTYISETQINFTPDFKVEVAKCKTKYDARQLFKEHNIDIDLTDQSRFDSLYSRFKSQYKNKGIVHSILELAEEKNKQTKKTYSDANLEEKLRISEARIALLEEENDLLKKFTPFLPKECKKGNKFKSISDFLSIHTFPNMNKTQSLKLLCDYLEVSCADYYKYLKRGSTTTSKDVEDELIKKTIIKIQTRNFRMKKDLNGNRNKYKYIGYRQLTMQISNSNDLDFVVNAKRVYTLSKELGM